MKILTKAETDEAYSHALEGGAYGAAAGAVIVGTVMAGLQRRAVFFKQLTIPFKAFLFTSGVTAATMINAERRMNNFEKEKYGDGEDLEAQAAKKVRDELRANASSWERARHFLEEHKWQTVCGIWVTGMGGSMAYLGTQKYLPFSQKLIHARMYAQLITIVALIGTAGLSVSHDRRAREESLKVAALTPEERAQHTVDSLIAAKQHGEASGLLHGGNSSSLPTPTKLH